MKRQPVSAAVWILSLAQATGALGQGGPAAVITAKAEMRPMRATVTLVGTVDPVTRSLLGAEVAGAVIEMPAREGDSVGKGQLLCRLDDTTLALSAESEEAKLGGLQASLEELLNGTRKETLARLKAELDAATAVAQRWAFELERVKRLHGDDYANEKEYQDTLAEQLVSEAGRLGAQAAYDEGVAGPRAETISEARFAVAEQQAVVARISNDLTKTHISASFAGHIVKRYAEVGNWLSVGSNVVELADMSKVLVRVDAPERAIPFVNVGEHVSVRIDALGASFDGIIRHVIPQADPAARTFPVDIEVENADFAMKAGMFARATIPSGPIGDILAVPKDALIDSQGSIKIAMIVDGENGKMAIPTFVTLGADDGKWVAITSGNVPPGADIAVYGNENLVFPQPVVIVQSPGDAGSAQPPAPEPAPSNETPPTEAQKS